MQANPSSNIAREPLLDPAEGPTQAVAPPPSRRVVDAPTRMFHWLFALSFVSAYLTGDAEAWRALHVVLGYTMAGLLGFRVVYGLVGPRHARLSLLWGRLRGMPAWLVALRQGRAASAGHWRQAPVLAMALVVAALLAMVVPLVLSGYGTHNDWGDVLGGDWIEEVHEFFGDALLFLVLAHLLLIGLLSLARRRNQALPMLTGRVEGKGPDLVRKDRRWLATLLLLAVLSYGAWEWIGSAGGLL